MRVSRAISDLVWYEISRKVYVDLPEELKHIFTVPDRDDPCVRTARHLEVMIRSKLYEYRYE